MSMITETTESRTPVLTADNFAEASKGLRQRIANREPSSKDVLPCSVANCAGHREIELLERWGNLCHEVLNVTMPTDDLEVDGINEGEISLILRDEGDVVYYYSNFEGEIRVDQLDDFIAQLKATVATVESFKDAARIIESN